MIQLGLPGCNLEVYHDGRPSDILYPHAELSAPLLCDVSGVQDAVLGSEEARK